MMLFGCQWKLTRWNGLCGIGDFVLLLFSLIVRNESWLEKAGSVRNSFVDTTQYNQIFFIGKTCYQNFGDKIGDLARFKINNAYNLFSDQITGLVMSRKLSAGFFRT